MTHRIIRAFAVGGKQHNGHKCSLIPGASKLLGRGRVAVRCECGARLVVPCHYLRQMMTERCREDR